MKILYLINHAGKAGTEKYVYNLVRRFHGSETECFLAFNESGQLSEQLDDLGVPCFQIGMKNPYDLSAAKQIAHICKTNHIDIIHAQYPRENYLAILSKLFYNKTKVIYTCHLTLKTGVAWWVTNHLLTPGDDKIIAVCRNAKDLLVSNGVSARKIDVIFNGIPAETGSLPRPPSTIRSEFGLDADTAVLSILARYHMSKGLDFLVDSMAALKKKTDRKFALLIAGDGEFFDDITRRIREKGLADCVYQLGYRADTENILDGSDIYLNSSKCYEALSFAILEAMAHSLPLVVTTAGGNPDIVNHETNCGFAVDYGDTEGFAEAVKTLIEDEGKRRLFAENAKKAALTRFDLEQCLQDTYKVYLSVTKA